MTVRHKKVLSLDKEKQNREEAVQLFYRTLSVNHPHVTLEKCYQLYDQIIADKKGTDDQ